MSFILTTDTACDIFRKELDKKNVPYIPLTYMYDGNSYEDKFTTEEDFKGFYEIIKNGAMPTTSLINNFTHQEFFKSILNGEPKSIVHLTLSGGLSGTFNEAVSAAEAVMAEVEGSEILIVDSISATHGISILVNKGIEMRDSGASATECKDALEELKTRINHWVYVDDLYHLKRGGRVSGASAFFGTLLKIHPILFMNDEGKLVVENKCRGSKKSINYLMQKVNEHKAPDDNNFIICHANAEENAGILKEMLKEEYPDCSIETNWIGPVIGSHTGIGVFTVIFVGKDKRQEVK